MTAIQLSFEQLTLHRAFDCALVLEREARDRYLALSRAMHEQGFDEIVRFFDSMARMEEQHRVELEQQRHERLGHLPYDPWVEQFLAHLPGPHSQAEADRLTLRTALELALRAEQRARQFFLDALDVLTDPDARALFGALAEEEIEHVSHVQEMLNALATLEPR